jgi:hypothetical protein
MPYKATVIPVMIASPSDVLEAREVAREVILEWNYINSQSTQVVIMPVGWETHSSPELGSRPQELINKRILAHCDLLVGIFWTRLGTPTGGAPSGTVEEIERHLEAGKPAMIYFSSAPVAPQSINPDQFKSKRCRISSTGAKAADSFKSSITLLISGKSSHDNCRLHFMIMPISRGYLNSHANKKALHPFLKATRQK